MNHETKISIVIPVFNRAWCVERAVDSAVQFVGLHGHAEVVLVDDGSTDDSFAEIRAATEKYSSRSNLSFRVRRHARNQGVCAAKNTGARAATGQWLVFFDSDDELMPDGMPRMLSSLEGDTHEVLHFFTAIPEHAPFDPAGTDQPKRIGFREYLSHGAGGEALPVVRREAFLRYPYDEDVRGYESLSYMRIAKAYGILVVHSCGLRRYYTSHGDRLSTKVNMRKRRWSLMKGHLRALFEHFHDAPTLWVARQIARVVHAAVK